MHTDRNDGAEPVPRRANPSPPVGQVHGLGESHALRVELRPVQLPWLAAESDELVARSRRSSPASGPATTS